MEATVCAWNGSVMTVYCVASFIICESRTFHSFDTSFCGLFLLIVCMCVTSRFKPGISRYGQGPGPQPKSFSSSSSEL